MSKIQIKYIPVLAAMVMLIAILGGGIRTVSAQKALEVSDETMKQVVGRILTWYFKPSQKPRKVYLLEVGVIEFWLPEIKNIEFVLLEKHEWPKITEKLYFFKKPEVDGDKFRIDFGRGDPDCEAYGDRWAYKLGDTRIRLWQIIGSWGRGCYSTP